MSSLRTRWRSWMEGQLPAGLAEDERPRTRVFVTTAWLAVAFSGVSVALAAASSLSALALLNAVGVVASLALLRGLPRAADPAPTVRRFLWTFSLTLSLGSLTSDPMELTTLGYLVLIPLVAATMLPAPETSRWFWRVGLAGGLALLAGQQGLVVPEVDPLPAVTRLMNFAFSLLAAMGLLRALARERERSLERLRQAERAKSAFFANVGHEIRTPMNGVLGMTDALLAQPLGEAEREMVETIRSSGGVLLALIDDLLDLSKLEAGRLALHEAPVPLAALAEELRSLWTPLAVARGLALEVQCSPALPAAATLDGLRLRQVLGNLVSNALKFTPSGRVAVRLAPDGPWLACEVEDTGIGIAPGHAARLFERFAQADDARARRYPGTGLGLALSRDLAGRMGGSLTVDSTPGRGSTFRLRLPLKAAEAPAEVPAAALHLPAGLQVLVVDDNPVNRLVAQRLLDRQGCQVEVVADGRQALAALERRAFDVVLMDVHMPELDGLEVTRRIRARGGRAALTIIGVSASADPSDVQRCLEAGMDGFLAKPVTRERLLATLLRHLDRAPAATARSSSSASPRGSGS